MANNTINMLKDVAIKAIEEGLDKVVVNSAVEAAAWTVAGAVLKTQLPPFQKLGLMGASILLIFYYLVYSFYSFYY